MQGVGLGRTGRAPADPDAGTLAQLLEQHWQALTQDAVASAASSCAYKFHALRIAQWANAHLCSGPMHLCST